MHLLTIKPDLRDNDERLSANVIHQFLIKRGIDTNNISGWQLLLKYANSELPTIDYITRVRRKIQEQQPELRGEKYLIRQAKQNKVRTQINNKPDYEVL